MESAPYPPSAGENEGGNEVELEEEFLEANDIIREELHAKDFEIMKLQQQLKALKDESIYKQKLIESLSMEESRSGNVEGTPPSPTHVHSPKSRADAKNLFQKLTLHRMTSVSNSESETPQYYIEKLRGDSKSISLALLRGLKKTLETSDSWWISAFFQLNGLTAIESATIALETATTTDFSLILCQCELINCLVAFLNSRFCLEQVIKVGEESMKNLSNLLFSSKNVLMLSQLVELLAAMSIYSTDGYCLVIRCLENAEKKQGEHIRFRLLVQLLRNSTNAQFKANCVALINCLVSSPEKLEERLSIRFSFVHSANLESILKEVKRENDKDNEKKNKDLANQLAIFQENLEADREEQLSRKNTPVDISDPIVLLKEVEILNVDYKNMLARFLQYLLLIPYHHKIIGFAILEHLRKAAYHIAQSGTKVKLSTDTYFAALLDDLIKRSVSPPSSSPPAIPIPPPPPPPPPTPVTPLFVPPSPPSLLRKMSLHPPPNPIPSSLLPTSLPLQPISISSSKPLPPPTIPSSIPPPPPTIPSTILPLPPTIPSSIPPLPPTIPSSISLPPSPPLTGGTPPPGAPAPVSPLPPTSLSSAVPLSTTSVPSPIPVPPPPPPPPLPRGTPPPPPPLPSSSVQHRTGVPLKRFYWTPIRSTDPTNVWAMIAARKKVSLNTKEIDALFCVAPRSEQVSELPKWEAPRKDAAPGILMDSRKATTLTIAMRDTQNVQQIIQAILTCDMDHLARYDLEALSRLLPSTEELEDLHKRVGDEAKFGMVDKFFLGISSIPCPVSKFEALVMRINFLPRFEQLVQSMTVMRKAALQVTNSNALQIFLQVILEVGNYLNFVPDSNRINGFLLESICGMVHCKASIKGMNLFDYMLECAVKFDASVLLLPEEICEAPRASLLGCVEDLEEATDSLKSEVARIREKFDFFNPINATFYHALKKFIVKIQLMLDNIKVLQKKLNMTVLTMYKTYGEPLGVNKEVKFFQMIADVRLQFQRAALKLHEKEQRNKRRIVRKSSTGKAPAGTIDGLRNIVKSGEFRRVGENG
eukprot:Phypoly_transcript_01458.p1 GENE.Phypoly_transcript_01458~~Phypoly_transcript_01458.p1  ORF type:complete len:1046 (+),score=181.25 Phypoly_transcript_01458:57-3194(+)